MSTLLALTALVTGHALVTTTTSSGLASVVEPGPVENCPVTASGACIQAACFTATTRSLGADEMDPVLHYVVHRRQSDDANNSAKNQLITYTYLQGSEHP
jgi:hypothetical protein